MTHATGCAMPDRAAPRLPLIRHVPWRQEIKVLLLSATYHREMTHHDPDIPPRGRDVPCEQDNECPYCRPGPKMQASRLTGWIAALGRQGPREMIGRIVLALPYLLCAAVDTLTERPEGLRGMELTLLRSGERRNESIDILDAVDCGEPMVPAFDVRPCLELAWAKPGWFARMEEKRRKQTHAHWQQARRAAAASGGA